MMLLYQLVLHPLRHASEYAEYALLFLPVQCLQAVVNLVLRILAHGASVKEDGIGIGSRVTQFVTRHLHDRRHHLGVSHVHLTPVCLYKQFLHFNLQSYLIFFK